jgi:acetolactate synthase-1/2/3 large subunit
VDLAPDDPAAFFGALRRCLPRDAVVVTDSGLHQYLVRRHFPVLAPRGLLTPTDFQAMGFGLPAAVGAAIAAPGRHVVAVVGDGGLAVAPLELATAVREGIRLTVLVLADGRYGLIHREQLGRSGLAFGTDLPALDLGALATAAGVAHVRLGGAFEPSLGDALGAPGVTLVEARVDDEPAVRRARRRGAVRTLRDGALRRARRRR